MRTIQFSALALVLGASIACSGKDSGDSAATTGATTGGTTGGSTVGAFSGTGGVLIVEAGCDIIWDFAGPATNGMDLMWDVEGVNYGAGSCEFGTDLYGTLEVTWYSVYFAGDYWGAAFYGGGDLYWYTYGYVYGGSGYTYAYSGSGSY